MTQKHFEAIAAAFDARRPDARIHPAARVQWNTDVLGIAEVCEQANTRFNRARFLAACGWGE